MAFERLYRFAQQIQEESDRYPESESHHDIGDIAAQLVNALNALSESRPTDELHHPPILMLDSAAIFYCKLKLRKKTGRWPKETDLANSVICL